MIQDRRKRIAIVLILMVLVIALLIFLLLRLFAKDKPAVVVVEEQPRVVQEIQQEEPQVSPIAQQQRTERIESASINILAKTFAERYGSFSNEANFQNLRDVMPFMSVAMAEETQSYIDSATPPLSYYGITTRVITVNVKAIDETAGTASLELTTQREEAVESPEKTTIKYQKLALEFVKEGDLWKVSSATWL